MAQKTSKGKATLPKGDRKPAKASGEKDSHWKAYALGTGAVTGGALGTLFYYGMGQSSPYEGGERHKHSQLTCVSKYTRPSLR